MENAFPRCRKCSEGDLVPLSDFGSQGASILAMDLSIRIAVVVNKCDPFPGDFRIRQGISQALQRFVVN